MPLAVSEKTVSDYYCATAPFHPGDVVNSFPDKTFDVVLGLDVGHCTTRAYALTLDPNDCLQYLFHPVKLFGEDSIPTLIRFDEDICVGHEAAKAPDFLSNFIKTPDRWEDSADGYNTYGEVMDDYFYTLLSHLRDTFPEINEAWLQDRLLLAVACPSGVSWLPHAETFRTRISDASLVTDVTVVPAPLPQLLTVMSKDRFAPFLGTAVYDLGGGSVEFSYVCAGKALIAKSLPVGGTQLDYVLLDKAMNACGLDEDDIPFDRRAMVLHQIGQAKTGSDPVLNVPLENGKTLTCDLSAGALETLCMAPGSGLHGQTFAQSLSHFFRDTALLLRDHPLDRVYLTGAMARLPLVAVLALEYFSPNQVLVLEEPETATARGLALCHGQSGDSIHYLYPRFTEYLTTYTEGQRTLLTGPYGFTPVAPECCPFDLVFRNRFLGELAVYYDEAFYHVLREVFLSVQDRSISTREVVRLLKDKLVTDDRIVGKQAFEGLKEALRLALQDDAYYVFEALGELRDDLYGHTLDDLYRALTVFMPDLSSYLPELSALKGAKSLIHEVFEPAKHVHRLVESVTSWGGVTDRLGDLSGEAFSAMHRLFSFTLTPDVTARILAELPETPVRKDFDYSPFFISPNRLRVCWDSFEQPLGVLQRLHHDAAARLPEYCLGTMTLRLYNHPADLY